MAALPSGDIPAPADDAGGQLRDIRCRCCRDEGSVCENHPDRFWGGLCCDGPAKGDLCEHGACHCGGAGMPCPACCSPIPQDGTTSITLAFVPDWKREGL